MIKEKIKISQNLKNSLNNSYKTSVLSVFDNSIDILCDTRIYVLHKKDKYITPMSAVCIVSSNSFETIKKEIFYGMKLLNNKLYLGSLCFWQSIWEKDLQINKISEQKNIAIFINLFKNIMNKSYFSGVIFQGLRHLENLQGYSKGDILGEYFLSQLQHILSDTFQIYDLYRLIGAGQGLTPSGDDFICGYMAALFFLGSNDKKVLLTNTIMQHIDKTTLISQEYLKYAIEGKFNEYVKDLELILSKINTGDYLDDLYEIIKKIASIGHSSGTDFLAGLYVGLIKEQA